MDKSFVDGLGENPEDSAKVEAVISLARALGMSTVVEGIETSEQAELLRTLGCDQGQGYYFADPRPAWEVSDILPSPRTAPDEVTLGPSSA